MSSKKIIYFLKFLIILDALCLNGIQGCTYQVRWGDICSEIVKRTGIKLADLYRWNPSINNPSCNNLQPGQILNICDRSSGGSSGSSGSECLEKYTVKYGDTCNSIANAKGLYFNAFMQMNMGLICNRMQPGQQVCVSHGLIKIAGPECTKTYTLTYSESCVRLSIMFSKFFQMNPGIDCRNLQPGQIVCIEAKNMASSSSTTKTTTTTTTTVTTPTTTSTKSTVSRPFYTTSTYCLSTHKIISGSDTCNSIVKQYNINYNAFITINPGIKCDTLRVNDELCVKAVNTPLYQKVNCLQTLKISPAYQCAILSLAYKDFLKINPGINCDNLQMDQYVCILAI